MTVREFIAQDVDTEVIDDYTSELYIAYVGPTGLTPDGEIEFSAVLDLDVNTDSGAAVVHIPDGDYMDGILTTAIKMFEALAGYCSEEHWNQWFKEV